ncbi:MAG: pyroglutamyl-peptidase I [Armatimonadota bacterium]|nr:pyroglutamyl-peptidase I [Armatimonadota bacterium]MDR7450338.1 pyroglutamyl-peptidase I [Armatimonadota bacterium]MDR7467079.1 pyroglutamyl-peptidase I [Armatimonadota bacterium]MDR7493379.1 pyroglutamyl-peptidase I [Armatimonadota bacterium]MDR7499387.1 pyroglutamyl-peptidase I [Armatimonadota bacterium]
MKFPVVLLTGFEPYGGRGLNPSAEVVRRLDGLTIDGFRIVGRTLPVTFRGLADRLIGLLTELEPVAVVSLGLWPGEPLVRLERVAFNLAAFEIPDNEGVLIEDTPIREEAATGVPARLPLRAIEQALLDAGIPARLSTTAGTFLCNATMYTFLTETQRRFGEIPCGFVHLPYLPEQVAEILRISKEERRLELHQRADLASMSLDLLVKAVRIILAETLRVSAGARH